jgi:hypothetical protein
VRAGLADEILGIRGNACDLEASLVENPHDAFSNQRLVFTDHDPELPVVGHRGKPTAAGSIAEWGNPHSRFAGNPQAKFEVVPI